jgi:hypothetical protein
MQQNKITIDEKSYELNFSYDVFEDDEMKNCPLEKTSTNSLFYSLYDTQGIWTPDTHNLKVSGLFIITNPLGLYGEEGVAPKESSIGLAIRWCSSTSKNRGVQIIANLNKSVEKQEIPFCVIFEKAKLRGSVTFYYEFFINSNAAGSQAEQYLASTEGTIIGEKQIFILDIDAKEQTFPIELFEDPDAPLWKLFVSENDPRDIPWGPEAVKIQLNKAHKDYKYINQDVKTKYSPFLLKEVLASAVSLYINKLQIIAKKMDRDSENLQDFLDDDSTEWTPGSVAEVVKRFQNEPMNFDLTSPIDTSISVHKYFDLKLSNL